MSGSVGLNNNDRKLLKEIREATADQARGFVYKMRAEVAKLIAQGLVEINASLQNPENLSEYAVRSVDNVNSTAHTTSIENTNSSGNEIMSDTQVTDQSVLNGAVANGAGTDGQVPEAVAKAKRVMPKLPENVVVVSGDDVPAPPESVGRKGGAGRKSFYPFAEMEVGTAFFVASDAAANRPDAVKSMSTTVSGANRASKKAGENRKFIVYAGPGKIADGSVVSGAWVKRVE